MKVEGHVGLPHLGQWITQKGFSPEVSNFVGRKILRIMIPIDVHMMKYHL